MDWSAAHSGFVLASYALSFAVLAGLILFIARRDRKLAREVQLLEKRRSHDR